MSDELRAAVRALQGGDKAQAQKAFAGIANMARREPADCAVELSHALREELATDALRTPLLLTLLGLTRQPAPEFVPLCLDLLRALAVTPMPPGDAVLSAAAVVARTQPRALLPDIATLQTAMPEAQAIDRDVVQALPVLFEISSRFLRGLPDSAVSDMARWLWSDCAALDLMSLVDFAGLHVERSGADDPIAGLMVDLVERVAATEDQKRYAGQRLKQAGVGATLIEQLHTAWGAIRVAPASHPDGAEPPPIVEPEPPSPEARVDGWLAEFSEGDDHGVELARAAIDGIFEELHPPAALAWWVAVTVDALPPRRRRTDINWALVQTATALRRHGESMTVVPPSLLRRWLDTPQFLDATGTAIALDLLSREQPGLVAQRYLHRAVAASDTPHAGILMGGLWRALAMAEPATVLEVASRWLTFGFGRSDFLVLLLDLLIDRARGQPGLLDALGGTLAPKPGMPAEVLDIARAVLDESRHQLRENLQP
jgi:hypothetical protein